MTAMKKTTRANTVRQRRSSQQRSKTAFNILGSSNPHKSGTGEREKPDTRVSSKTARQTYHPASIFLPVEPRPVVQPTVHKAKSGDLRQAFGVSSPANVKRSSGQRMVKNQKPESYDFSIRLGRTAVRGPGLSLPKPSARWFSAGMTMLLGLFLYAVGSASIFKAGPVEVTGNQRIGTEEINSRLGLTGQPIYTTIPSQVEKNLRIAFPDLAGARVQIGFPNAIRVSIVERTPILAWYQDSNITWIDSTGVALTPRGDFPGLIQIASSGDPPKQPVDPLKSMYDPSFLAPEMVQAIVTLHALVPSGAPMIYDSKYGIGWQDARGWSVYFGQNSQDIELKIKVYQALLESFSKKGIQPTLISVAYLDAPFYK